jgi:3-oxoacyl-[acyl-carrier-protein] synthase II
MEMRAFKSLFRERKVPVYSIKGAIGHTMGAAALIEIAIALRAQYERSVPPTVNLKEVDDDAIGWVTDRCRDIGTKATALVTNAGFSGVNSALILV